MIDEYGESRRGVWYWHSRHDKRKYLASKGGARGVTKSADKYRNRGGKRKKGQR